jgi:hypothetical protein
LIVIILVGSVQMGSRVGDEFVFSRNSGAKSTEQQTSGQNGNAVKNSSRLNSRHFGGTGRRLFNRVGIAPRVMKLEATFSGWSVMNNSRFTCHHARGDAHAVKRRHGVPTF